MIALIFLLCAITLLTAFYYFWTFGYWKKRGVKTFRPNILFGNVTDVVFGKTPIYRMLKDVYAVCKKRERKFMGFYFINVPILVLTDIELIKKVLIKDFKYFTDRQFYFNEQDPLTVNIGSAKGKQWKKMREQLSPAFSPNKLKCVSQILLQVGDQLKSVLDKSAENCPVVNLADVSAKYIVDAIGMSVFGIECNTLKNLNMDFKKFADNIFGGSFIQNIKLTLSLLCPSVLQFCKIPFNKIEVQNFYLNLVKSTVEYREKNNVVRNDLMHSIIQLRNNINIENENDLKLDNVLDKKKSLKIEEITAHVLFFLGAAYETSSSIISFCIYELALNEDVQNNLRKEITSVLEKYNGKIDYDAIMEMTFLDKCISETLRLHVVAAMTTRTCSERYQLPDTDLVLDVGNVVYIPIFEIHHDPEFYPNPEKFDPERFSHENKLRRPNCTFLSFGEGPRNCVGSRLATLQVKIFLVTFLRNYNFTINSKFKLPPTLNKSNIAICFENPLYVNIEKI